MHYELKPFMKIIFFGSDDFAAVHLEALIASDHEILAVVCPPDKARGRGMKTSAGPVKELALARRLAVLQPENVNAEAELKKLKKLGADLFVVIAYGKILSQPLLDLPKTMPINVHSSLLPKYRGAAPINWAVIHGEKVTGISVIKMSKKMDAGDIVAQMEVAVSDRMTAQDVRLKMMELSPAFLIKTIGEIERGSFLLEAQDEAKATPAPKLTKELGEIDWTRPAVEIRNLIRGLQPWPGAHTSFNGQMLKVLEADVDVARSGKSAQVLAAGKEGLIVAAGKGALELKRVHLASAKPMSAGEFIVGHKIKAGDRLGA
jgi:methionyl-tRNA formyltransferase